MGLFDGSTSNGIFHTLVFMSRSLFVSSDYGDRCHMPRLAPSPLAVRSANRTRVHEFECQRRRGSHSFSTLQIPVTVAEVIWLTHRVNLVLCEGNLYIQRSRAGSARANWKRVRGDVISTSGSFLVEDGAIASRVTRGVHDTKQRMPELARYSIV